MRSQASRKFWALYARLPADVRVLADKQYALFLTDPMHPSLRFKLVAPDTWSARVTLGYRAVGHLDGDAILWFWIGKHADYDRLLAAC